MLDPEEMARQLAEDPEFLASVQEETDKATSTVMELLWSGVPMQDALDIVRGAIMGSVLEDGKPK